MIAITQEHITFIIGLITIGTAIKGISVGIDKKINTNNGRLINLIDKKLDTIVYEEHKKAFEKWSNEKDRQLEERLNKLEFDIKGELKDIKASLKSINEHMLNCNKRGVG